MPPKNKAPDNALRKLLGTYIYRQRALQMLTYNGTNNR